ncbi:7,8-didemethyl-8-hydroxy-5-deazariboflavin synthase [subsurface metagenome]
MTEDIKKVKELKSLSIRKLKEKVNEIKNELDKEEQKIITYSKNFTLSLSNYCQNQCGYCFYNHRIAKETGEKNVVLIEDEKVDFITQNAAKYGCKEALLM